MIEEPEAAAATAVAAAGPQAARDEPAGVPAGGEGQVSRFWSVRRVPAALVALVSLAAVGVLLYDVVAVRADRPATEWRRTLAEELATRTLGDGVVVLAAVAAVLLGVWLLALALTPGLRNVLPMRRDGRDLRAGIEREAAAVVLSDRAMDVSGVRSVRVKIGRHRVRVFTQAHFRDLDEVRQDLKGALRQGIDELGLARQFSLSVYVRRPAKR